MSEIEDRRQRAREAFYDGMPARRTESVPGALDEAIETATRVQITPEVLAAGREAWSAASGSWAEEPGPRETARLAASLRALGFEVVE